MSDIQTKRKYIPALTGFRGIAAWMVFCHHLIADKFPTFPLHHLYVGVTFFFALSGYLIFYQNYDMAISRHSLKTYFAKRLARIYPVYFLILTVFLVIQYRDTLQIPDAKYLILNYTLLKGWFRDYIYSGISQSWSLTVEEAFYFTAPFLFFFLRKGSSYRLLLITLGSLVVGGVQYYLINKYVPGGYDLHGLSLNGFFFLFPNFAWGIFFARAAAGHNAALLSWLRRLRHCTYYGLGFITLCMVALQLDKGTTAEMYAFSWIQVTMVLLILPIGIGLFLYGLTAEESAISRTLGSRVMVEIGKASYILYLIHYGFIQVGIESFLSRYFVMEPILVALILFVTIQVISLALYYCFEKPMARVVYRWLTSGIRTRLPSPSDLPYRRSS